MWHGALDMPVPSPSEALLKTGARPLVGVVHLPPLAGPGRLHTDALVGRAVADAQAYSDAGFDAVIVENLGDVPYPKDTSDPHVVGMMTRVVTAVVAAVPVPVGVNLLRNDALGALGVCHATGASFIRVNILSGAAVTDQGIIEGRAREVIAYRRLLGHDSGDQRVAVLADIDVKHAAPLAPRPLEQVAKDTAHRAGADVLLVTGPGTGKGTDLDQVARVRAAVPGHPVWVASGLRAESLGAALEVASGAIVGSDAKQDGDAGRPVDPERAGALAAAAGKPRRSG